MVSSVSAIVLAAGQSRRMGSPKMVLPWGETTVIGQVVGALASAGVDEIVVVTGGARQLVETALAHLDLRSRIRTVFNVDYAQGEMLSSVQTGLRSLDVTVEAALICLGDQPRIQVSVIGDILKVYAQGAQLVVPSYQMRRGHPWLVSRNLWPGLLALGRAQTLRDFLNLHADLITYLAVETDSVLMDLDTPEDYQRNHPS